MQTHAIHTYLPNNPTHRRTGASTTDLAKKKRAERVAKVFDSTDHLENQVVAKWKNRKKTRRRSSRKKVIDETGVDEITTKLFY
jgi:hypothetical protein